jgi:signal transduction histidine kinase
MDDDTTRMRSRLVESVFACAAVLVLCAVVLAAGELQASPGAFLAVAGFAALAVLGARLPRVALALTILGIFAYYTAGFPPIGMVLPATGALYLAAASGRTPWAVGGAVVLFGVSTYYRLVDEDPAARFTGYEYVTEVALAAAAIALGAATRLARERQRQATRIAELVAAEQAPVAEQRMAEQRIRIARELHDTVGHRLTVVALHTSVASEALGTNGERDAVAQEALERVREANSEALRELRAAVRLLRRGEARGSDPLGIVELARTARRAGLRVEVEAAVNEHELHPAVAEAASRILTEATTNVLRHARASTLRIGARTAEGWLDLEIVDDGVGVGDGDGVGAGDGTGADGTGTDGSGIAGMRERARIDGGTLEVRTAPDEGFAVIARLPLGLRVGNASAESQSDDPVREGER